MFLRKILPFQVVRNPVIEIQIIKQNDNYTQDSAMSSSWAIPKMGFYFIWGTLNFFYPSIPPTIKILYEWS